MSHFQQRDPSLSNMILKNMAYMNWFLYWRNNIQLNNLNKQTTMLKQNRSQHHNLNM